jgi:hypothetical protein
MERLSIGMGVIFLLTVGMFGMTVMAIRQGPILNSQIQWGLELDLVHTGAGIFILGIFSIFGFMNDYPRMYLYGVLFGLGYVVSTYIQDQNGILFYWPWATAGALAVLLGLATFTRFLKEYPLPREAQNG